MLFLQVTYTYRLKLEKESGDPINSECECPAGKGPHGTCKHLAAVLFVMLEFSNDGVLKVRKSCTENLQTFNRPTSFFTGTVHINMVKFVCHLHYVWHDI